MYIKKHSITIMIKNRLYLPSLTKNCAKKLEAIMAEAECGIDFSFVFHS
jgi:hypothetical protein